MLEYVDNRMWVVFQDEGRETRLTLDEYLELANEAGSELQLRKALLKWRPAAKAAGEGA
jgi:hypothetical protein